LASQALVPEIYIGNLRIQVLSDALIRFEEADASGFEDQQTFHIISRFFAFPDFAVQFKGSYVRIKTALLSFDLPVFCRRIEQLTFQTDKRKFKIKKPVTRPQDLPEPSNLPDYYLLADYPRIIPPEMGATAPGKEYKDDLLSGWQISDNAVDFYVFFPALTGYKRFRREITNLTGQIPLVPKYILGLIYSRYHPFKDSEIFELVRRFKLRNLPVDLFVVDTDWRVSASTGYEVNKEYFPDIETFFSLMHKKNIRVMFNDHPEPFDEPALSPVELQKREEGLGGLIKKGLDCWWYDRNWKTSLDEPAPGLGCDVWGMRLYYDITQKLKPQARVVVMSNVPGIKNGEKKSASNIATHRYPIWWTGDSNADWQSLKNAVKNAVNEGLHSLLPFVSDDIGGHFGQPSPELYARFVQFACFAPIFRLHCTAGQTRDPWHYGEEAERVIGNYLGLRLKLLPMLYNTARQASEDSLPLLRRCDLEWPEHKEAQSPFQYLFGDDLLVAPVFSQVKKIDHNQLPTTVKEVWLPPGFWHDAWTGRLYQGPVKKFIRCPVWQTPLFVRDGAMIISQPHVCNTASQNWQKLVLDIFVPEQRSSVNRELYEDDGITSKWLEGNYSLTGFSMKRNSGNLEFRIGATEGQYDPGFNKRSFLLRFHFSKYTQMASITLNNSFLLPENYSFITRIARPAALPFICRPGYTGKESGATLELKLTDFSMYSETCIKLCLR
jgi:alpha-glucosidase (family GH31 glycosyl hydrolase)